MKREFLITKFVCAKCGDVLEIERAPTTERARHCDGEPTGAAMVASTIVIEPCKRCAEPFEAMRRAAATLFGAVSTEKP